MTTTYDPHHPAYLDEPDVRGELTRVFDVCQGCRRCFELCTAFPTLFELIDRFDDHDAGRLTPAEQDRVVGACIQCTLCHVNCPYVPELHEWQLDFPRLLLRADAMRVAHGQQPVRTRATTRTLARTDRNGSLATRAPRLANALIGGEPGSATRRLVSSLTGVSPVRLLPPYAKQRFSTWFEQRAAAPDAPSTEASPRGTVTVFPTCLVEYHEPDIGRALVGVYERNGIGCTVSSAGCCGAPWLHAGDLKRFARIAKGNVRTMAAEVRAGTEIVVPQPTCSYVLRNDYVDHVRSADAELVAAHTHDAAEYLAQVHTGGGGLDTDFRGPVPDRITYHTPCRLRAQRIGFPSRELLQLTGAEVELVQQCSGTGGTWGLRAGHEDTAIPRAEHLGAAIVAAAGEVVAGDCHLANTAILEQTGTPALHPLQIVARAYGLTRTDADDHA